MSQENVEIVRSQVERFKSSGELSPETCADDLAWHDPPDFPDAQVHVGVDGAYQALAIWAAAWTEWQIELEDYLDAGERVLVRGRQWGKGKATGIPVEQPLCLVYLLRAGRVTEVRAFFDERQALQAAGLTD